MRVQAVWCRARAGRNTGPGPSPARSVRPVARSWRHAWLVCSGHRSVIATIRRADRSAVLEAGRITEEGTWEELTGRPGSALNRILATAPHER